MQQLHGFDELRNNEGAKNRANEKYLKILFLGLFNDSRRSERG
jgi:hypothetical protein